MAQALVQWRAKRPIPSRGARLKQTQPVGSPSASPPQVLHQSRQGQCHTIALELFEAAALDSIQNQLANTGGLFITLNDPVPLNSAVDVCIMLPVINVETWFEGRVVAQSPAGTALDVHLQDQKHNNQWAQALHLMREGHGATLKPSNGPSTLPPRQRRHHTPPPLSFNNDHTPIITSPPDAPAPTRETRRRTEPSTRSKRTASGTVRPRRGAEREAQASAQTPPPQSPSRSVSSRSVHKSPVRLSTPPVPNDTAEHRKHGTDNWPILDIPAAVHAQMGPVTAPRAEALAKQAPVRFEASLARRPLEKCLMEIAHDQDDGIVALEVDGEQHFILLQMGSPADILSLPNNPEWSLGALLVKAQKMTWEQHKEAQRLCKDKRIEYAEALVRLRVLSYPQVQASLKSRIIFIMGQLLQLKTGRLTHHGLTHLPYRYSTPPVSIPAVLFKNVYRQAQAIHPDELERLLGEDMDAKPVRQSRLPCALAELQMGKKEQRFFEVVLGNDHRTRSLISISNLNRSQTLALIHALRAMDLIQFQRHNIRTDYHNRLVTSVRSKTSSLEGASPFDVLDVHWSAYTSMIEEAYREQRRQYNLNAFPELIQDEIQSDIETILAALDHAREELRQPARRREIRAERVSDLQISNSLGIYLKKGDLSLMRGDVHEALSCFRRVLELDPRHPHARQKINQMTRKKEQEPSS